MRAAHLMSSLVISVTLAGIVTKDDLRRRVEPISGMPIVDSTHA